MKTVISVIGARPQFIKAAPVSHALKKCDNIKEVIVHTGQHYDAAMSDVFFEELGMNLPDYHLGVGGLGHGAMIGAMLQKLEPLLLSERPDYLLVYGDTNSTLAGALAAAKLHIPVAHVESGLRSFNRRMPEEQNRIVTDHLSDCLFSPTNTATENLIREGIDHSRIIQVGDVMYDAAILYGSSVRERNDVLIRWGLKPKNYILSTVHRAENTDDGVRLRTILESLDTVSTRLPVIFPLHPRTRAAIKRERLAVRNVKLIEPVGYLDMVALECQAAVIVTDSGGVQKEAYFHGVPCVTLRNETEWVELVELGWNHLAPIGYVDIYQVILNAITKRGTSGKPYGDGHAAKLIIKTLKALL